MKKLSLVLTLSMLIAPLVSMGQITTVFQDTFPNGALSTLNPTAASPGTHTSTRTAYEIASSKGVTSTAITPGTFLLGPPISTTSGYVEAQATFTGSPVVLSAPGQYIQIYYTFTDTSNLFNGVSGNNAQVNLGLYNSGGSGPTNGTLLWSSGLASGSTTAVNGGAQNWLGFSGQMAWSLTAAQSSGVATRPAQTGANNLNQGLGFSSGYANGVTFKSLTGVVGQPALVTSNQYTLSLQIMYVSATSNLITVTLYNGVGINGPIYSSGGFTATFTGGTTAAQTLTSTFDALEVGFRPTASPTAVPNSLQINSITVISANPIAPAITGLTDQTVVAGTSTTLSPAITGVPAPALQWQTNGVNITGATNATLPLNNVQFSQNGYVYSLIATNSLGAVTNSMTLTVIVPPSITGLNDQAAGVGDTVNISPTVSGVPAPTLQWRTNGVSVSDGLDANGSTIFGSTSSTLTITNAQTGDTATYSLVASNSAGMVTNSMHLTVASGPLLPTILGPTNLTVIQGNNATFSASASGVPLPTLQWLDQTGTPITGANTGTLILSNVLYAQNGFVYSIVASNTAGSVTNGATLTVVIPPAITAQPVSVVTTNGQSVSFTVGASGVPAVAYQWYKNSNAIPVGANASATTATLTINPVSAADMGTYYAIITNQFGSTNTVSVTLTVNSSTMTVVSVSPANGATGICYDTPLAITFNQAPSIVKLGKIRIYNSANGITPVETIDLSQNNVVNVQGRNLFSGDSQAFNYFPVVITGNKAAIYLHASTLLTSNQTYYVNLDDGVFADASGAYFGGIADTNSWQFTTKPGGPVDPVNPMVNANGTGDFLTVQGAIDSLATNAAGLRRTINIANGAYFEIVNVGKTNVTLRGQSRAAIIFYPNNANVAIGGTTHARMTLKVNANDVALDNLTVSNSTPQGGSQAEALMIEGNGASTAAKRCVVNNCEIDSRQDTILANINASQAFFYNTKVNGNFDYIWGGGNLFFLNCTLHTISGASGFNLTASRTDSSASQSAATPWGNPNGTTFSANGFSFVGCTLEADAGVSGITMAGNNGSAGGLDSWAFCKINGNAYIPPQGTLSNSYVFWQFQNTDTNGVNPVTFTNVQTIGVTNNDPRVLAATNLATWFYGWTPALLPNILSQPTGRTAGVGQSASFSVSATGFPDPSYQWLLNGAPISGATSATYNLASAARTNGGNYAVVVSNGSGSVTSSVAVLTYTNTPPVAGPASFTRNAAVNQLNISISDLLTHVTDADGDTITLVSVGQSTNLVTPVINGNYVNYGNTNAVADQFSYTVSDGFGGTNSVLVTVNVDTTPLFGASSPAINTTGGSAVLDYTGIPGYRYSVLRSTNVDFSNYETVLTTNVPAGGVFEFIDAAPPEPSAFYRLQYNP